MSISYQNSDQFYIVGNIDTTSTGPTLLGTIPPTDLNYYPLYVRIFVMSASGVITPAIASVGTNASSYNNILALTTLTGLLGVGDCFNVILPGVLNAVPSGTSIYLNIGTAAIATDLTIGFAIHGGLI